MTIMDEKQLLILAKSKNPRCFQGVKTLSVNYFANKNA